MSSSASSLPNKRASAMMPALTLAKAAARSSLVSYWGGTRTTLIPPEESRGFVGLVMVEPIGSWIAAFAATGRAMAQFGQVSQLSQVAGATARGAQTGAPAPPKPRKCRR